MLVPFPGQGGRLQGVQAALSRDGSLLHNLKTTFAFNFCIQLHSVAGKG